MAEIKAKADKESSSSDVKYSFFAGRWQPLHKGHLWLINERLKEGYNVWLGIRDVKPDEKNPWTAEEILEMARQDYNKVVDMMEGIERQGYKKGVGVGYEKGQEELRRRLEEECERHFEKGIKEGFLQAVNAALAADSDFVKMKEHFLSVYGNSTVAELSMEEIPDKYKTLKICLSLLADDYGNTRLKTLLT